MSLGQSFWTQTCLDIGKCAIVYKQRNIFMCEIGIHNCRFKGCLTEFWKLQRKNYELLRISIWKCSQAILCAKSVEMMKMKVVQIITFIFLLQCYTHWNTNLEINTINQKSLDWKWTKNGNGNCNFTFGRAPSLWTKFGLYDGSKSNYGPKSDFWPYNLGPSNPSK